MVVKAKSHEALWDGISTAAEVAAQRFSALKRVDPQHPRRKKFENKMKQYASDLLYFVQASAIEKVK